jgi:hypothetical protein
MSCFIILHKSLGLIPHLPAHRLTLNFVQSMCSDMLGYCILYRSLTNECSDCKPFRMLD